MGYRFYDSSQTFISSIQFANQEATGSYDSYTNITGDIPLNTRYVDPFYRAVRGSNSIDATPETFDWDDHNAEVITSYGVFSLNSSMNLNDNVYNTLTEVGEIGGISAWYNENDVDNNAADVDSSADIGTETTFSNAQGTTLDSSYMNIQEGNGAGYVAGNDINDYHDNITDTDSGSNPDLGTYSNGGADMDSAPDGTDETLTEENTAGGSGSEWLDTNALGTTYTGWTEIGTTPFLSTQNQPTDIIETKAAGAQHGWFDFPSTTGTGTLTVNASIYCQNDDGAADDYADIWVDYTGSGAGSDVGDICQHTAYQYDTISLGTHTVAEVNALRVYFVYQKSGGADEVRIDHLRIGVSWSAADNYEFDRQVGFTSVDFDETNEELCIFTGTIGAESLIVQVWDSGWTTLVTIVDANDDTWINTSITAYLDSAYFAVRFLGGTESGDTTQSTWNIDAILIHSWTTEVLDYEINFEYQWTTANTTPATATLAINAQNVPAGEDLDVWYWGGSDWISLGTITTNNWLNVTATGLTSTYTIMFNGTAESGDTTQDDWDIDLILIRTEDTDTRNYHFNREVSIEGIDTGDSYDNFELVINTGTLAAENIKVEIWNQTEGAWELIVTLTSASAWTNTSLSQNFWTTDIHFRFNDTTQTGDGGAPSTWQIDYFGIHVWSASQYGLEWEHQAQFIDETCDACNYYLYIYGNASEDMDVTFWDDGANDWYATSRFTISSTLAWFNLTIPAYAVAENITWQYVDTNRTNDDDADILSIDFIQIFHYNASINIVESSHASTVVPFAGNTSFDQSPFDIEIDSGIDFNITVGCVGCGSIAFGFYVYFDNDSNPAGAQNIKSESGLLLYEFQSYTTTDLQIWWWGDLEDPEIPGFEVDSHTITLTLVHNIPGLTV
jgi:hypothetical protein